MKANDGNILQAKNKLVAKYGESYLLPLTEEEEAAKQLEIEAGKLQEELIQEYIELDNEEQMQEKFTTEMINRMREEELAHKKAEEEKFLKDFPSLAPTEKSVAKDSNPTINLPPILVKDSI